MKNGRPFKVSDEQIRNALIAHHGFLRPAAKSIDISHVSLYERILKNVALKELWEDFKETRVEEAELRLFRLIKGEIKAKDTCVPGLLFFLKTQAKHKGYGQEEIRVMNESYVKEFMEHQRSIYENTVKEINKTNSDG